MNIPHEVEELILAFVGLKRKKRCIAQTSQIKYVHEELVIGYFALNI